MSLHIIPKKKVTWCFCPRFFWDSVARSCHFWKLPPKVSPTVGGSIVSWDFGSLLGRLHPWRLTWNIIMEGWKIIFLSKWVICMFHVNLPGCINNIPFLELSRETKLGWFKDMIRWYYCLLPSIISRIWNPRISGIPSNQPVSSGMSQGFC